jgi:two-component system, sensor histidine kinase
LVVEDEEIILADLVFTMNRLGYQVAATASTGTDAIRAAAEHKPDLVLMDLRLQGRMSGLDAAREIQGNAPVPILFVTAHAHLLMGQAEGLSGPHKCLAKPFSSGDLSSSIEAMLSE